MGAWYSRQQKLKSRKVPAFAKNPDAYKSREEVTNTLKIAGLEASQLVVGVDFTASNITSGRRSFNGRSLHDVTGSPNPYCTALSLISRTMEDFDDDNKIACYGFGDATAGEHAVFSFFPNDQPADGFDAMLARYSQLAPHVKLAGPTTFAPLIRQTMRHVYQKGMTFHLLLIIADGQLTTKCMKDTEQAIVDAANFPISIVMIGVGDGPWHTMADYDDKLPARGWDNFQFVDFNKVMNEKQFETDKQRDGFFAMQVLMELPAQYKSVKRLMTPEAQSRAIEIVENIPSTVVINPPQTLA